MRDWHRQLFVISNKMLDMNCRHGLHMNKDAAILYHTSAFITQQFATLPHAVLAIVDLEQELPSFVDVSIQSKILYFFLQDGIENSTLNVVGTYAEVQS